ncbi:MAG: alpha-amylase family glycosyl hydrolase [bacterium]
MSNQIKQFEESPKIYNLFPRLVGNVKNWLPHIKRAYEMGFNWIYINPFHPTGSSGSLYAIKDHFGFNPLFFGSQDHGRPASNLKAMIREANKLGVNVMADLVINHTSKQSPLVREHPDWFKRDDNGHLIHPGAMHKGKMVYWRDLAEIDNLNSQNRDSLWAYWLSVIKNYLDLGFTGFRCDAAYQVPTDLWCFLIEGAKRLNPASAFFAETLGCPVEQTLGVAKSGFDYIFNSFKWWNLQDTWFTDQLRLTQPVAASVSFPESHDTTRLAADLKDNIPNIKQRYLLSALVTKGVMVPIGFEFGFHKKLNVKLTSSDDWEEARFDLSGFIKEVNLLKASQLIFNQELPLQRVPAQNQDIMIILKDNINTAMEKKERFLLITNINNSRAQTLDLDLNSIFPDGVIRDLSMEDNLKDVPRLLDIKLRPYQVRIFLQSF